MLILLLEGVSAYDIKRVPYEKIRAMIKRANIMSFY